MLFTDPTGVVTVTIIEARLLVSHVDCPLTDTTALMYSLTLAHVACQDNNICGVNQ